MADLPSGLKSLASYLQVILILLVGTTASLAAFWVTAFQVESQQRLEFEWVAHERNRAFRKGVEARLDALRSLHDLLSIDPQIDRQDFHVFAHSLLSRYPAIDALEWLPRVPDEERERHESLAREAGAENYEIRERGSAGAIRRAERRPEYFPVRFQEPGEAPGPAPGFDRSSDPAQRSLIERARESGKMVVSERIPLEPGHAQYAFMAFLPVFAETGPDRPAGGKPQRMLGVVVGIFRLSALANASIALLEPRGIEFLVLDESAPEGRQFLDFYASRLGPAPRMLGGVWEGWSLPEAPRVRERFPVADRVWSITCSPTQHFRSGEGFKEGPWVVLAGGMALTLLAAVFMYSTRKQMSLRLSMEQELRGSEQKLRILFNQSPDIIMTVDRDGQILFINRALPQLSMKSAVGRTSSEIVPKEVQERYGQALQKVFRTGEISEFQYSRADSRWWEVRIVPLRMSGVVTAAMVIATDVTERRVLESQAIRSARLASLGVLAASVAHEINNPNNAIQFNASLLQKSFDDIVPILQREAHGRGDFLVGGVPVSQAVVGVPKLLAGIGRNAARIQTIVANLKHMVRHDGGEYDHPVDLREVLQAAYSILQHQIQKHTDCCELELPESLPLIRGNPQQLEQVFINLMLNALQSLPDRSSCVWVSAATEDGGEHVVVRVVDQGCGIEDEDLSRIFDPFFTRKGEQDGTGLGLSISQRIIQNHGGAIELTSEPHIGTEVTVRFPVIPNA